MTQHFSLSLILTLFMSLLSADEGRAQEAAPSAKELAARLSAGIRDGSSLVRMKLESGSGTVLQLQAKSRRDAGGTHVLYQILWPRERKGEGFVLRQNGNRAPEGNTFVLPGTLHAVTADGMDQAVFGTDLCYADLVENFFAWSQQSVTGQETVDRVACTLLESKPGGGDRSIYGMVRSWIDPKRMVPLRVEKFNKSGQLVRRITTTKVAKDDTRNHVAASFTVQRAGQTTLTNLEGSNSRHDVTYEHSGFAPDALRSLGK